MSKIIATIFYVNQTLGLVSKRVVRFPNPLTDSSQVGTLSSELVTRVDIADNGH